DVAIREGLHEPLLQHAREAAAVVERKSGTARAALNEDPEGGRVLLRAEEVGEAGWHVPDVREVAPRNLSILHQIIRLSLHRNEERIARPESAEPKRPFDHREERDGDEQHGCREKKAFARIHGWRDNMLRRFLDAYCSSAERRTKPWRADISSSSASASCCTRYVS